VLRASAAFEAAKPWKDRQPPILEKQALKGFDKVTEALAAKAGAIIVRKQIVNSGKEVHRQKVQWDQYMCL